MIIKKNYKVCVAHGDGRPITTEIAAASGIEALDLAQSLHPGARNIHVLGLSDKPLQVKHPLFDESVVSAPVASPVEPPVHLKDRADQIECCLRLRSEGLTHRAISAILGVGSTTIGRWIKQYG